MVFLVPWLEVGTVLVIGVVCLYRLQNLQSHIRSRTREVLPSIHKPLHSTNENDNGESDNTVI
jgi:hypothetical protein